MVRRLAVRCVGWFAVALALWVPARAHAVDWLPFGPDGGDARRIVADPADPAHLYLGTTTGWIYESHDTGANWKRLARVGKRDDLVLDNIVVDEHDPKHLLVGAWVLDRPDGGMYISFDGGRSWVSQAEMRGQSVRSLAQAASDPKTLVAGTLKGVFRSTDGGARWKQISPLDSTEIHEVESVAIDPQDPNVIYAGTWHLPWKTTDGGDHWANIKEGIIEDSDVFSIIVDPEKPKVVYASACSGIYKSEDAGELFHKVQGIPSTARRTRVLQQDPNNLKVVFAGTTEGLWRTDDAGETWNRLTGPEVIVNDVEIDKADSKRVMIATDRGGVFASDDGGDTFHSSNAGFSARQITAIHRDVNRPARVLVGVVNDKEWGGIFESANGGLNWRQLSEGLAGRDVFSLGQAPDGTMLAGTAHGIYRLDPASETWTRVTAAPASAASETPRMAIGTRSAIPVHRYQSTAALRRARANETPAQRRAALKATPARARPGAHGVPASRRKMTVVAHGKSAPARAARAETVAKAPAGTPAAPAAAASLPPGSAEAASAQAQAGATAPGAAVVETAKGFDGAVYGLTTAGDTVLATTSDGLLVSVDDGITWSHAGPEDSAEWRFLAAAKKDVVAASLHTVAYSADAGKSWQPVIVPTGLSQIGAVAVEPSGELWVGGREGVYVSSDGGNNWTTPTNLSVSSVNSIYWDAGTDRMLVTTGSYSNVVFVVQLPSLKVTYADTGWNLRFARPIGDHFIAATLFDGIVVQPRMIASPMTPAAHEAATPPAATPASPSVGEAKAPPSTR